MSAFIHEAQLQPLNGAFQARQCQSDTSGTSLGNSKQVLY